MLHLLNLLAAISLLVWGTHIVRTGVLRVFGENLRQVLAKSFSNRLICTHGQPSFYFFEEIQARGAGTKDLRAAQN